jgi:hypothetical protein
MKKCVSCGEVKEDSEFSPSKQNKDGLASYCKVCNHARVKAYYEAHPDKKKESTKRYSDKTVDKRKAYYEKNKDKIRSYGAQYREQKKATQ